MDPLDWPTQAPRGLLPGRRPSGDLAARYTDRTVQTASADSDSGMPCALVIGWRLTPAGPGPVWATLQRPHTRADKYRQRQSSAPRRSAPPTAGRRAIYARSADDDLLIRLEQGDLRAWDTADELPKAAYAATKQLARKPAPLAQATSRSFAAMQAETDHPFQRGQDA